MGVRFACHACDKRLNIKQELAGRRGVCPACGTRFRIPLQDADRSEPVEASGVIASVVVTSTTEASRAPSADAADRPGQEPIGMATQDERSSARPAAAVIPDPLADQSVTTWYVRPPSGGQYGPATTEVLRQWISEGRVSATALLWREGWSQWRESQEVLPQFANSRNHDLEGATIGNPGTSPAPEATFLAKNGLPARHSGNRSHGHNAASMEGAIPVDVGQEAVIGNSDLGRQRRERNIKRGALIGFLALVSVLLIVALVAVLQGSG